MGNYNLSPGELGHGFEDRVKRAYESNGHMILKKNQWKTNYAFEKDLARKREYDIVTYNPGENQVYIIECKAHYKPSTYVRFKQVHEFERKLKNYNGTSAVRVMVSDTDFTNAAKKYAQRKNILLINHCELRKMENQGGLGKTIASKAMSAGLETIVNHISKKLFK
jgi:hypothetical protein